MTLIIHIWTNNLNVIAGDGRITEGNSVITNQMRKIYENQNAGINVFNAIVHSQIYLISGFVRQIVRHK